MIYYGFFRHPYYYFTLTPPLPLFLSLFLEDITFPVSFILYCADTWTVLFPFALLPLCVFIFLPHPKKDSPPSMMEMV